MPIQQLDAHVAAKIAAGEVVERPASVVKELIENSIDAGATSIRVELLEGGLQLIRVIDDGCGILPDELSLALSRHATSKLHTIDDLERIRSLGFRGEALASIAAVADVTITSRAASAPYGASIHALNGMVFPVETATSAMGTSITVRNLFTAVPARLKFLKTRATEVAHCHHLLEQYAFAYPEIRFSSTSEGRELFATDGSGEVQHVLVDIYGIDAANQMIPVQTAPSDYMEAPSLHGYISLPSLYKSTRQHLSFFVNRRWVLSRMLNHAVEEAYHSLLLSGRHPLCILNIQLDPALLDINVHPAKTEIRFLKERVVYVHVLRAVREALIAQMHTAAHYVPASASVFPRLRQEEVQQKNTGSISYNDRFPANSGEVPYILQTASDPWITVDGEEHGSHPPIQRLWQSHVAEQPSIASAASAGVQSAFREQGSGIPGAPLPPLRVIGQVLQSYILAEGPASLYIVDQHAAHERILLEKMLASVQSDQPASQLLLTPTPIHCTPSERASLEEYAPSLHTLGFDIECTESDVLLRAVPALLLKRKEITSIVQMTLELISFEPTAHGETWQEYALANLACKAAIKAHYFLTIHEMCELLEQLEQTRSPYSCCHGRPTITEFDTSALARLFERR